MLLVVTLGSAASATASPAQVDLYLRRLVPLGFAGNVLLAQRDRINLNQGYGLADRERGIPMRPNTVISIGSITKQFTAAAILKLEMQSKLRVTDRIGRFFPNVPQDKREITLHELLTHTAGLQPDYGATDYEPVSREAYIERVMRAPLASKPGSTFSYSNAGYSLLAAIIEMRSRQSYEKYLRENIFLPAGMRDTGYRLARWAVKDIAVGYDGDKRWGTIPEHGWAADGPYWNLRGNGGIESTPLDMYAWHRALERNTVLSAAERKKFETGYVFEGPMRRSQYAYGWSVQSTPHGKLVQHNGGNGIYAADFLRFVDSGTAIYIAGTNAAVPAAAISRNVTNLLFGRPVPIPPAVVGSQMLSSRVGTYRIPSGSEIQVRSFGQGLDISSTDPAIFVALNSHKALPPAMTADVIARTQRFLKSPPDDGHPRWKALVTKVGGLVDARVIGAVAEPQNPSVWVLVTGRTGRTYTQFTWGPDGLEGVDSRETLPATRFYPESADKLFGYEVIQGRISHVHFRADGALEIGEGAKAIVAERVAESASSGQ